MNTHVTEQPPRVVRGENPFEHRALDASVNAGAVEIESSRAIAEAQGKLVIAKRFPRDPYRAVQSILDACARPSLAESSMYEYRRGGEKVRGPSIRLAEEIARCWGNVEYGMRELSNRDGVTEMEAYAWDLETNTYSAQRFTVRHVRDTRQGTKDLTDQRDIYEMGANLGARRMRARILAIIPDDVVEAAVRACHNTIAHGGEETLAQRLERMVASFRELSVTASHLERHLGHPLSETLPDELVSLAGIYKSIRDGQSRASEWFGDVPKTAAAPAPDAPPATYPEEAFTANLPKWRQLIESGKRTAAQIVATVESKAPLTAEQRRQIEACAPAEAPPETPPSDDVSPETQEFFDQMDSAESAQGDPA